MDLVKLKEKIVDSGYKLNYIQRQLNLSKQGFLNKISGKTEFNVAEAGNLSRLLSLTNEEAVGIFFTQDVELYSQDD